MPELNEKSIQELVKLARNTGSVQIPKDGAWPFVIIPEGSKVEDLTKFIVNSNNERPLRKEGTAKTLDATSFCEYYTLFHDENSRVFSDETTSKILAVLDYHAALEGAPRWGKHRIDLTLRHSEEWTTWKAKDGQRIPQMEFAEFVEDNGPDIIDPDAATMLEVARDLSAKSDVDFASAIRMNNGSVQFKYSEQTKGTFGNGSVEVPERFVISVPVYIGTDRVSVTARLRYRINAGKLTFWYDLLRADAIERDAFKAVQSSIGEQLGIHIINGSPA